MVSQPLLLSLQYRYHTPYAAAVIFGIPGSLKYFLVIAVTKAHPDDLTGTLFEWKYALSTHQSAPRRRKKMGHADARSKCIRHIFQQSQFTIQQFMQAFRSHNGNGPTRAITSSISAPVPRPPCLIVDAVCDYIETAFALSNAITNKIKAFHRAAVDKLRSELESTNGNVGSI